jgi:hypothetical protein
LSWIDNIEVELKMKKALTFIIPVRHQDNARDWDKLKRNLQQTVSSIARQISDDWKAVIVANVGADLPQLPPSFEVKRVDFPPNQLHEQGNADKEEFYEAVRIDKGRRILAGMLHAGEMQHVMIVDDDDFVSRNLVEFVAKSPNDYGWYVRDGYLWDDGANYVYLYADFSQLCGSSHIIRADLLNLPPSFEAASDSFVRSMLGSHIFIREHLKENKTPLAPLPFTGAVYRVGHIGSHSKSQTVFAQYFFQRWLLRRPLELFRRLLRLRPLSKSIRQEYFGVSL